MHSKKTIVLRAFSTKISTKLSKQILVKQSFIIKISKSELTNSALEDENNGTEESETSYDEYLSDFKKLQSYMCKPCVSKESLKEN